MAPLVGAAGDSSGDNAHDVQSYTACHNTLDTPELLENILLHLPMRDLLLDQRICRTWKACIDNSVKLQKGLFFKPAGKIMTLPCPPKAATARMLLGWSRSKNFFTNPLLVDAFGSLKLANYILLLEPSPSQLDSFTRPEASWRRMLVTQPPPPSIDLVSRILKARKEVMDDAGPDLMAVREAFDSGASVDPLQRSIAVLRTIDHLKERLLSTLPPQSQQPVKHALDMMMNRKPQIQQQQAFLQLVVGFPIHQALNIMTLVTQFALRWAMIHDASMPLMVGNALLASTPYESAKQLQGL